MLRGEVLANGERRYFIGDAIGQGGFGMVYDCSDDWGNPLVAKILIPHEQSYREVRRVWQDELRKLLVMRHPNITFVYDAFEYKDTFYLIIERCSFPLSRLITRLGLDADPGFRTSPVTYCRHSITFTPPDTSIRTCIRGMCLSRSSAASAG